MTYMEFIKNAIPDVEEDLIQKHHVIPKSIWRSEENRETVSLSPAQHAWAHVLYDREHGTNTKKGFIRLYSIKEINSYEDCLFMNERHSELQKKRHQPTNRYYPPKSHEVEELRRKKISETMKKDYSTGKRISYTKGIYHDDTYKKRMSETCKSVKQEAASDYWEYKKNGGSLKWNEYCRLKKNQNV